MLVLTGSWTYNVIALLITVFTALHLYYKWAFGYFKRHGIPEQPTPPSFPFGHIKGLCGPKNLVLCAADLYKENKKEKIVGAFFFTKPIVFINDPDIAKEILVKEFISFPNRWFHATLKVDSFSNNLFVLNGQDWKSLRSKLTPAFTTGKMKMMFPTLLAVGDGLIKVLDRYTSEPDVEVTDVMARYTTDVISSLVFGIECNSLENPDCDFRKYGSRLAVPTAWMSFVQMLLIVFSNFQHNLSLRMIPKEIADFFSNIIKNVMEYRQTNNVKRDDFMQLLLQLKAQGYIADSDHNKQPEHDAKPFTLELAAAQAFLFFFAGFETSSVTMQFILYELALNPDIQKRVRDEVNEAMAKHDGQITYDALNECHLLDRVMSETLRMYPVAGTLVRQCNRDYKVPDTDVTIVKGTNVWLPIYGYQHDPKYYPNPEKFDPNRFLPEEKAKRHKYTYLPFGEGPRYCIGKHFANMLIKAGLSRILKRYNITPSKRTTIPMLFNPTTILIIPKGGIYLKLSLRN